MDTTTTHFSLMLFEHGFLDAFSEFQRSALAYESRHFTAAAGEYLARIGEPARTLYLIHSGRVAVECGMPGRGVVPVQTIGSGEVVDCSCLILPERWPFDCRALDTVEGLAIDVESLQQMCQRDPGFGCQLFRQLLAVTTNRLNATRLQLLEMYP